MFIKRLRSGFSGLRPHLIADNHQSFENFQAGVACYAILAQLLIQIENETGARLVFDLEVDFADFRRMQKPYFPNTFQFFSFRANF
jgi:hypothetical protein